MPDKLVDRIKPHYLS